MHIKPTVQDNFPSPYSHNSRAGVPAHSLPRAAQHYPREPLLLTASDLCWVECVCGVNRVSASSREARSSDFYVKFSEFYIDKSFSNKTKNV